jgi:hypothetical protein
LGQAIQSEHQDQAPPQEVGLLAAAPVDVMSHQALEAPLAQVVAALLEHLALQTQVAAVAVVTLQQQEETAVQVLLLFAIQLVLLQSKPQVEQLLLHKEKHFTYLTAQGLSLTLLAHL